ncbi:MAG: hypothetical protein M3011_10695 [Actinomycetota bacterium]|nr:hypothetical protein [Actinomycetota bacterium]
MQGPSTKRLALIATLVVSTAIGAVLSLVPSIRSATLSSTAGPKLPGGATRPAASGGKAPWLMQENARPGTTDWKLGGPLNKANIEGYADTTSATDGETVRLFVSTGAASYVVEAYRMGWYGGTQGRLVWKSAVLPGTRQPAPTVDRSTAMAEAHWVPSLPVTIDKTWPPGDYLFKLVADTGHQQYVPLTIRDDTSHAAMLVVDAVTTWQAYNKWGGHSLYEGVGGSSGSGPSGRSQVVSFERPYANDSGAGDFLGNELPFVSMVEREGYDVTYWTDIDLHHRSDLLANHKAMVTLGHDEYWSVEMRAAAETARDQGINLAFLGPNAVYRAIRLTASETGDFRHEVNYRVAKDDPMTGVDNSRVTVSWREPPVNRPESSLVGDYYQCNPAKADMVVSDPSAWVFAGTGLAAGDKLPGLIGIEFDRYDPSAPAPPGPVQVLTHSPVTCKGEATYSDMTYYSAPSGAGVFATGTGWVPRLNKVCDPKEACFEEHVDRITRNVLDAFAAGPAGISHPSVSNYKSLSGNSGGSSKTSAGRTTTTASPPTTEYVPPTTLEQAPPTTRRPAAPTSLPTLPTLPTPKLPDP